MGTVNLYHGYIVKDHIDNIMLNTIRRHGVTLAIFAALTTGLTALVNHLTHSRIEQQQRQQQKTLLDQVIPPALYDNDLQSTCYLLESSALGSGPRHLFVARKGEVTVAAAVESTAPDGYSGAIQLLVGADFHGMVLGVRTTEHHETPGLGDKIELRLSDWITHFTHQRVESAHDSRWAVKRDGGMFDQFTGATITPRAVVNAVKRTALYLKDLTPEQISQLPRCSDQDR